tara:strand:+ start:5126 stop:5776 length:651 start_codon:yes stop_codon:yes gene_type:complete
MKWFLDMCIVLYHIGEGDKEIFIKKSQQFINEKRREDKFLICYYIKDENIPKWINRQRILFRELIKQINNSDYEPYSSKESKRLYKRDKKKIIKLITLFRNISDRNEIIKKFENTIQEIEIRINIFFKEKIDKFVIPLSEINFELKSAIFTFTNNHSDSLTIASGIQYNQKEEIILLTADKKDWNKSNLEWVFDSQPELIKKYKKIPKIKYLQNFS